MTAQQAIYEANKQPTPLNLRPEQTADLAQFRQDRAASPIADLIREKLGLA